jgi:flavodoxin I
MADTSLQYEPLTREAAPPSHGGKAAMVSSLLVLGFGLAAFIHSGSWQYATEQDPAVSMAAQFLQPVSARHPLQPASAWRSMQPALQPAMLKAESTATTAAIAALRHRPRSGRSAVAAKAFASAMQFAGRSGVRAGCRGQLTCVRAVGLFFDTQSGKTEEVADMIAEASGVEVKNIGDVSVGDLAGYDGLIVGLPTWNTGADEQRSGTQWDDYLEEIKGADLCGKPVAVFGSGDSVSYGDNFCDAIEELHSTFAAAGAKMLGYVDASAYQHTESKSVVDGKFLGLPLDQDNEDDMSADRVKAWVDQLKSEGMPLLN